MTDLHDAIEAALSGTREAVEPVAWVEGIDSAPHACTLLATYFNDEVGEWIVELFVAELPKAPFTHWALVLRPGESAAPPSDPVGQGAVTVKPLEWNERNEAMTVAGWYFIEIYDDGTFGAYRDNSGLDNPFATLEEAKAAAQADYETRILSALSPAPEAGSDEVEGLRRDLAAARAQRLAEIEELKARETALRDQFVKLREAAQFALNEAVADDFDPWFANLRRTLSDAAEGGQ